MSWKTPRQPSLEPVTSFFGRWHLGHRVWSCHCAAKTFRVVRHGKDTSPGKQENRIKPMVDTADSWMTKLCPFAGCASASCEGKAWKIWQKGRAAWLDPKAEFRIPDWHTLVGSFGSHDKVKDYQITIDSPWQSNMVMDGNGIHQLVRWFSISIPGSLGAFCSNDASVRSWTRWRRSNMTERGIATPQSFADDIAIPNISNISMFGFHVRHAMTWLDGRLLLVCSFFGVVMFHLPSGHQPRDHGKNPHDVPIDTSV